MEHVVNQLETAAVGMGAMALVALQPEDAVLGEAAPILEEGAEGISETAAAEAGGETLTQGEFNFVNENLSGKLSNWSNSSAAETGGNRLFSSIVSGDSMELRP